MDCLTVNREELAEKYLQGKLDSARQDEFETHLLECARCTQELASLQAMRQDLAERAHEIRGWTASRPFFRWQVAVLSMVLLMALVVGINHLRESKRGNESAGSPPKKQKGEQAPLLAEAPNAQAPSQGQQAQAPTQHEIAATHSAKREASGATPKETPQEPLAVAEAPAAGQSKGAVPTPSLPDSEGKGIPVPSQTTATNLRPATTSGAAPPMPTLTTAQGVELARIGTVEAPAYTFSGIVAKGKLPRDDKRGGFSPDRESQGAGRALFQEGMNKYVDGHYSEAAGYLEQAVQLEPGATDINFYLGICKLVQGHPEESVLPLKNAAGAGQSIYLQPSHYYLAKAYVQGNKFADAEEEFRKAIAVPGRLTSDAKRLLARLQTLRGQIEKP